MAECIICEAIEGRSNVEIVYEDSKCSVFLVPMPASNGHLMIVPKKHYQILEQVPDYEIGHLFNIANKMSIAVFEAVQAKGTNILISNGVSAGQKLPHLSIHIIPRDENDNLGFQWQPIQMTEEQMSTVELKLKEGAKSVGNFIKEEKKEPIKLEKTPEKIEEPKKGENYLLKQLRRIP